MSRQINIITIQEIWKINDDWWSGIKKEIKRDYYLIILENHNQITIYKDLISGNWFQQNY